MHHILKRVASWLFGRVLDKHTFRVMRTLTRAG
jgi:hypothetical protein